MSSSKNTSKKEKWIQIRVSESEKNQVDELLQKFKRDIGYTELFWIAIDLVKQQLDGRKDKSVDVFELHEKAVHVARVDLDEVEERVMKHVERRMDDLEKKMEK